MTFWNEVKRLCQLFPFKCAGLFILVAFVGFLIAQF